MPFFCVLTVVTQRQINQHVPISKKIPLQSWTPRKSALPFLSFRSAPAIGDPIKEATDERPHDMPRRVPRRERSGHMAAKEAEGRVTRPAERKPG